VRWLAIANPAAGSPLKVQRAVAALARVPDLACEVTETRGPGDATRIAKEAQDFDGLVAVGGDGTICEIVNGMALDRQVLAVLPAGHGNCLARDLGVGRLADALGASREPRPAPLDLLDARFDFADDRQMRRWYASTLAAGYVAEVVTRGRGRLSWLGGAAYAAAAMLTVPRYFVVRLGGELRRRNGMVINNTVHLANFRGLPDASVRDGRLDVMEQACRWPRQLLHNLSVLADSRRFGPVGMRQADRAALEFDAPCTIMADGELVPGVVRLEVECRPGAARSVVCRP
jgi:diacylglycerol kinase family enzyme